MCRKLPIVLLILIAPVLIGLGMRCFWHQDGGDQSSRPIPPLGAIVDRENGIAIHSNGKDCYTSHGKHFSADDGYYYGRRWQCVEFVKRYYHDRYHHLMPDVWGHAKSFFDPAVKQGEMNRRRGLVQYRNGGNVAPQPGDLLVYNYGEYGHVAIVSKVESRMVEIAQQNVAGHPRASLPLRKTEEGWILGDNNKPAGWLRLPQKAVSIKQTSFEDRL